jgi:hypothetical protein
MGGATITEIAVHNVALERIEEAWKELVDDLTSQQPLYDGRESRTSDQYRICYGFRTAHNFRIVE